MNELVGEVFDGMSEALERAPGLGGDAALARAQTGCGNGLSAGRDGETGSRRGCHSLILTFLFGQDRKVFR